MPAASGVPSSSDRSTCNGTPEATTGADDVVVAVREFRSG